jgi:UDP-2-acetamido-3-amino-2,3-dideoxy-glucuronate N-acetyltransferase
MSFHPLSEVQSKNIGDDTNVWQYSIILANAIIGEKCNINCHVFIENDVIIGNNVTIKSGVQLWDGIRISDNVFIGPNVTFTNNLYPRSREYPNEHISATIEEGASIGANSTIIGNIVVGKYALIGAGSVLTKSVGDFELWYGNPCKHKGYVSKSGDVFNLNFQEKKTGRKLSFEEISNL